LAAIFIITITAAAFWASGLRSELCHGKFSYITKCRNGKLNNSKNKWNRKL